MSEFAPSATTVEDLLSRWNPPRWVWRAFRCHAVDGGGNMDPDGDGLRIEFHGGLKIKNPSTVRQTMLTARVRTVAMVVPAESRLGSLHDVDSPFVMIFEDENDDIVGVPVAALGDVQEHLERATLGGA